jgi:inhibitor of KinA
MIAAPFPLFRPAGDSALLVELGAAIDLALNRRVHALDRRLAASPLPGVVETVPAYCSILIHYDPLRLTSASVIAWAQAAAQDLKTTIDEGGRLVEIPTVYGGDSGPDLDYVARAHGLSAADVVRLHSGADYTVYMMGFLPGFAYLGGLPPELATSRLDTPRARVSAGSVGIAGEQTGVYPLDSPGGWRLIGRTAMRLFDPANMPPALLCPGDRVRFVPITREAAVHGV